MPTTTDPEVEEHLERISEDGWTVLHDVFDDDTAAALVDRLDELEDQLGIRAADNSFEGRNTVRIYNLLAHGSCSRRSPSTSGCCPWWRVCSTAGAWSRRSPASRSDRARRRSRSTPTTR
ncbi:MAG: hypothetical protein R2716_05215 [Microthrixaceae bacterium]